MKAIFLLMLLSVSVYGQKKISQFTNSVPVSSTLFLVENTGSPNSVYNNVTIQQIANYIATSGALGDTFNLYVIGSPDGKRITFVDSVFTPYIEAGQLKLNDSLNIDGFNAYSAVDSDGAGLLLKESATEYVTAWSKDGSLYLNVSNGRFSSGGAQFIFSITGMTINGEQVATLQDVVDSASVVVNDSLENASRLKVLKSVTFTNLPDSTGEYELTINPTTKRVYASERTHAFLYFTGASKVVTLTSNASWYMVDSVWSKNENVHITILAKDTIQLQRTAHYEFHYHITGEGANGIYYNTRIFNVTKNAEIPIMAAQTGQGAGNRVSIGNTAYCTTCEAGDKIIMQMQAETNTQTFTASIGSILILCTHGE